MKIIDALLNDKYIDEWDPQCTYMFGDIITYNHSIYKSLKNNNSDNNPILSEYWVSIL